jgi:DNA-binding SARP family transcriptional activator
MTDDLNEARNEVGLTLEPSRDSTITISSASQSLKQARSQGDPESICVSLIRLAHLHFRQGRYHQTRSLVEEVLRDAPTESLTRCDALRILGNCAAEMGDPGAAENFYHQAIDLARELDYRYALYKCLHSLATNIYWPRGQFSLTLSAGKEALAQAQMLNLGEELWFPLSDLAWVYWSKGQVHLANEIADQMEKVIVPGSLGDGFYCCLRAGLMQSSPDLLQKMLPLYDRARSIAETSGDPGLNVEVRLGLCRAYRLVKDLPAAVDWAEDAVDVTVRMKYRQFQALALIERGRVLNEMGDVARSEVDFLAAIEISSELKANFDLTRASLYLAALYSTQHRPEVQAEWTRATGLIQDHGFEFLLEQERALVLPWIAETLDSADPVVARSTTSLFQSLLHVPPAPITLHTLGGFSLQIGSGVIAKENLRQRRAGELLVLLLSSPGYMLSSDQVTDAMCPEKDPRAALDFYHHATSALRRLLEPDLPDRRFPCRYLEVDEERIALLLPPGSEVDFWKFEKQLKMKNWEEAIQLYQGEFLPAFRYIEWTIPIRQRFADQYEAAALLLAQNKLEQGDNLACIDIIRQVILRNPWQERAVELGMQAAMQLGDRTAALQMYQRLEKVLAKELGIAPQKELQQLYAAVKKRAL